MAHQHRSVTHNPKTAKKKLNLVRFFELHEPLWVPSCTEQASSNISTTSKPSPSPPPQSDPPLGVNLIHAFAHKQIAWFHKSWASVCNAPSKHNLVVDPDYPLRESSQDDKCSHQENLQVLPSLEKHILLYMSEKSLGHRHALPHVKNSCKCSSGSKIDKFQDTNDTHALPFVGILIQTHGKETGNLARGLADGGWAQTSFHNLAFARLRGEPGMIWSHSSRSQVASDDTIQVQHYKDSPLLLLASSPKLLLRSFKKQILQAVPHHQQQENFPDKEMLDSVQDFFMYTEYEGRKVFEELDRDADGKLTLEDVTLAMKKVKLPIAYAKKFMQGRHWLWHANYFGWSDFSSLLQKKEPAILELFNSLGVSKSGTIKSSHLKDLLVKAGLSATDSNVTAMMKFLAEDASGGLKYGQFRRFMLLLPTEQLAQDPWSVWLKAATTHEVEPLSGDFQLPVLNYVSLISKTLCSHFGLLKERGFLSAAQKV